MGGRGQSLSQGALPSLAEKEDSSKRKTNKKESIKKSSDLLVTLHNYRKIRLKVYRSSTLN